MSLSSRHCDCPLFPGRPASVGRGPWLGVRKNALPRPNRRDRIARQIGLNPMRIGTPIDRDQDAPTRQVLPRRIAASMDRHFFLTC